MLNVMQLSFMHHCLVSGDPTLLLQRKGLYTCSLAIVRAVPESFPRGLLAAGLSSGSIDLASARLQHEAYVAVLRESTHVSRLIELAPLHDMPDSVFVEDSACKLDPYHFLIPSSAATSRADEAIHMAKDLARYGFATTLSDCALDGGDILRVGDDFIFVGMSSRSNEIAVSEFKSLLPVESQPLVLTVPVPKSLHLKTIVTWISMHDDVVSAEGILQGFFIAPASEEGRDVIRHMMNALSRYCTCTENSICWLDRDDAYAANTLQLGRGTSTVLMAKGYSRAVRAVRDKIVACGAKTIDIVELEMTEFQKANGALTCLSIVV